MREPKIRYLGKQDEFLNYLNRQIKAFAENKQNWNKARTFRKIREAYLDEKKMVVEITHRHPKKFIPLSYEFNTTFEAKDPNLIKAGLHGRSKRPVKKGDIMNKWGNTKKYRKVTKGNKKGPIYVAV